MKETPAILKFCGFTSAAHVRSVAHKWGSILHPMIIDDELIRCLAALGINHLPDHL